MFGDALTINISNSSPAAGTWAAFGFNEGLSSSPGVTVNVSQSSEAMASRESATNPFLITKLKIKTAVDAQLDQPIVLRTKDSTGKLVEVQFSPRQYEEPDNKVPGLIVINSPGIKIYGGIGLRGTILNGASMSISMNVKKLLNEQYSPFSFDMQDFLSRQVQLVGHLPPGRSIVLTLK